MKNFLQKVGASLFILLLAFQFSLPALAANTSRIKDCSSDGKICNPLGNGNDDLFALVNAVLDGVMKLGAILAVLAIIYSGFLFVTAGGDEGKIKTAKLVLLYTVIGAAILLGAKVIATVIQNTVTTVGNASK